MTTLLLAVDPGVKGTGLAWGTTRSKHPEGAMTIEPQGRGLSWQDRTRSILVSLQEAVDELRPTPRHTTLAIEMPVYGRSNKFRRAAASGALVKVSMIAGAILGVIEADDTRLLTPNDWKGELPKSVTMDRLRKKLQNDNQEALLASLESQPDHAWDAVGIWLHMRQNHLRA